MRKANTTPVPCRRCGEPTQRRRRSGVCAACMPAHQTERNRAKQRRWRQRHPKVSAARNSEWKRECRRLGVPNLTVAKLRAAAGEMRAMLSAPDAGAAA